MTKQNPCRERMHEEMDNNSHLQPAVKLKIRREVITPTKPPTPTKNKMRSEQSRQEKRRSMRAGGFSAVIGKPRVSAIKEKGSRKAQFAIGGPNPKTGKCLKVNRERGKARGAMTGGSATSGRRKTRQLMKIKSGLVQNIYAGANQQIGSRSVEKCQR